MKPWIGIKKVEEAMELRVETINGDKLHKCYCPCCNKSLRRNSNECILIVSRMH
jgi:hypothetical protein